MHELTPDYAAALQREGIPTTIFRLGDAVLHKTVWMEHGHNTTYVRYMYVEGPGFGACDASLLLRCALSAPAAAGRRPRVARFGVSTSAVGVTAADASAMPTARPGRTSTAAGAASAAAVLFGSRRSTAPQFVDYVNSGLMEAFLRPV